MMTKIKRFLIALIIALVTAGISLAVAGAQSPQPDVTSTATPGAPGTTQNMDCGVCHTNVHDSWQNGPHGQSMVSDTFQKLWLAQGKPGACLVCHSTGYDPATGKSESDSVACQACHSPVPPNHPVDPMPVDTSTASCARCHTDPTFNTAGWQSSAHYQRGMTCTVCHDPHTAGLKMTGTGANKDASALCMTCHKDAMQNFPLSTHAKAGVTCVNCHLGFNANATSEPSDDFAALHQVPDHSFVPSLDTCIQCHSDQMHAPGEAVAAAAIKAEELGGTPTMEPTPVATPIPPTSSQPAPVSPLGFATVAGLLGLAGGMVLAPWLEKAYHSVSKGDQDDES